ncbi:MAG TPA: glycosyltransferase, partial [Lacipirellulaceae bacterium]|nr:glycosyltransferase [Lacipirellulaceae bacterium]
CVLFCGKLIHKKRPLDVIAAIERIVRSQSPQNPLHLLFVGSGLLEPAVRERCDVRNHSGGVAPGSPAAPSVRPPASFAGFLNQSQICEAYVATDVLALASDAGETWGLVVNECMAAGIPAVVSDQCGCAEDLPARLDPRLVFRCGDVEDLARALQVALDADFSPTAVRAVADRHHLRHTVAAVERLYAESRGAHVPPLQTASPEDRAT